MARTFAVTTASRLPGNADVMLLGRARGRSGYLNRAAVSAIAWTLTDTTTGEALASGTFAASAAIYDSLQLDDLWVKDSVGYNFAGLIPASACPVANSGHRMQGDVKITLATGEVLRGAFSWPSAKVYG